MKIACPYCAKDIEIIPPNVVKAKAEKVVCPHCHRPIAVYASQATLQMHRDRAVKAVAVSLHDFSEQDPYLEIVESRLADSQRLPIPIGESVLGRFTPNSKAEIQVLTDDIDLGRNHARLWLTKKGSLSVADNDSVSGTYVNGQPLAPTDKVRLWDGDVLTLGATTFIVHL